MGRQTLQNWSEPVDKQIHPMVDLGGWGGQENVSKSRTAIMPNLKCPLIKKKRETCKEIEKCVL